MILTEIDLVELNRSVQQPWYSIFITGYGFLFSIAILCNSFVIIAGYRRYKKCTNGGQRKRSELMRCLLVIYLAVFGLLICLTLPTTAITNLAVFWPFSPDTEGICQYSKFAPAMIIYSTSMIVIIIAVDSYRNVVHPLKTQLTPQSLKYTMVFLRVYRFELDI